jgi:hypothetical protein
MPTLDRAPYMCTNNCSSWTGHCTALTDFNAAFRIPMKILSDFQILGYASIVGN